MATIIAAMLAGLGAILTSSYARAMSESNYANAINLADAGVNYEIRRVTANPSNADLPGTSTPPGNTVTLGNGSFRVYCTMTDGHTAWNETTVPFMIISTGISGTTSRTVNIKTQAAYSNGLPNFALFGTNSLTVDSPSCSVPQGDIGCNGSISCSASVPNGKCWLAGSSASQSGFTGTCVSLPSSCSYPTCSQCALSKYPNSGSTVPGGLTYLQYHNSNSACGLPTYNCNISGSCTLTGPCDVCVQSISLSCHQCITCNNTNGPVNIWVQPGSGNCTFQDNSCVTCTSSNPANCCTIYCANSGNSFHPDFGGSGSYGTCSCDCHNNCSLQCNIYACNGGSGTTQCYDNTSVGCCISDNCGVHNSTTCTAATPSAVPAPIAPNGYSYGNYWLEIGGM